MNKKIVMGLASMALLIAGCSSGQSQTIELEGADTSVIQTGDGSQVEADFLQVLKTGADLCLNDGTFAFTSVGKGSSFTATSAGSKISIVPSDYETKLSVQSVLESDSLDVLEKQSSQNETTGSTSLLQAYFYDLSDGGCQCVASESLGNTLDDLSAEQEWTMSSFKAMPTNFKSSDALYALIYDQNTRYTVAYPTTITESGQFTINTDEFDWSAIQSDAGMTITAKVKPELLTSLAASQQQVLQTLYDAYYSDYDLTVAGLNISQETYQYTFDASGKLLEVRYLLTGTQSLEGSDPMDISASQVVTMQSVSEPFALKQKAQSLKEQLDSIQSGSKASIEF